MINIQVFDGEILGVILPDKVSLKITECEQAVKGDTATSAQKNAVVETGLQVKVPLFIQEGETIVVSTHSRILPVRINCSLPPDVTAKLCGLKIVIKISLSICVQS